VRLPGSGGACEIALLARRILVIARLSKRTFVEKLDFQTTPGFMQGGQSRAALAAPGQGPEAVITDMGVLRFAPQTREMFLVALHPGCTVEAVQDRVAWPLCIADDLAITPAPTTDEMAILRGELDTAGRFR
jgi:glutaconate CoA-transferase subunit B